MHPGKAVGGCFAAIFGVVWIGGWSAGTLFFDYTMLRGVVKQINTRDYKETTGTILESTTETVRDSEGSSEVLKLRYAFTVKGREYEGKDESFAAPSIGSNQTIAIAAKYKPGQRVAVYYDPSNPSSAVLARGFDLDDVGSLLFVAMFMTPFNLIMVASWCVPGFLIFKPKRKDPPVGVTVFETATARRIRLKHTPPWVSAVVALGAATFIMIFVMVGGIALFKTTLITFAGWAVVALAMALAYRWQQRRVESGLFDVVVDGPSGVITIPPAGLKRPYASVPYGELYGVTLEKDSRSDGDGGDASVYIPQLLHGELQRTPVLEMNNEEEAKLFAQWFARTLKTEFKESGLK